MSATDWMPRRRKPSSQPWARVSRCSTSAASNDIAAAVAYLASDDASYVTGQEIVVDGGFLVAPVQPFQP